MKSLPRRQQDGLRALHGRIAVLSGHPESARRRRPDRLRRRSPQLHPAFHAPGPALPPAQRTGTRGARARAPISPSRCEHFQQFLRRRGIVVVISDFYEQPETYRQNHRAAALPRQRSGALSRARSQRDPARDSASPRLLVDLETAAQLEVTPEYARDEYREKMDAPHGSAARKARGAGMDYHLLVTDQPLDRCALREYLSIRQGRD